MIKYTAAYLARLDEKVQCDKCGKQLRLGQCVVGFKGRVCEECARKERERRA